MPEIVHLIAPYIHQIAYWLAIQAGLFIVNSIFGHKTQIEAFIVKHPNLTLLLRFTRSVGIDPNLLLKGLKEWLTARSSLKITTGLLVLFAFSCSPARYPTPQELAVLLANTTDKAVSAYILDTPESAMPVTADFLIEADERIIEIARLGGNACLVVKDARTIAKAIKCTECTKIAEQIEAVAKCPL